jgi:hypothetical protein
MSTLGTVGRTICGAILLVPSILMGMYTTIQTDIEINTPIGDDGRGKVQERYKNCSTHRL